MRWTLFLIPFISASIGWLANGLALKLLFHPQRPKKVLGLTFQGLLPGKLNQLAITLGKLVSSELLSFADLEQKIASPENVSKIMPVLEVHIDIFLREKLTKEIPMIGMLIGDRTISQVKAVFLKELQSLFPILMKEYMMTLQKDLDVEKMVIERVQSFSCDKLEEMLKRIMGKEFRLVALVGAVLGFIIGILQLLLILTTTSR